MRSRLSLVALVASGISCGDGGHDHGGDEEVPRPVDGGLSADSGGREAASGGEGDGGVCMPEGERRHAIMGDEHVHRNDGIVYNSNPPSSGPHCETWGRYGTYSATRPLPRCNYIHNLEHGAVVLLYNCPRGCPEIVAALEEIMTAAPADPDCPQKRLILTPDPQLDTTVAAVAWGFTWKSGCLDLAARTALSRFVVAHWGRRGISPEATVCQ